jgi:hypothetical protein
LSENKPSVACRDADDAVYGRDGYDYDGYKLRVEFPKGGNSGSAQQMSML